jgi:phosphoribosylaminoimidazole (AIR) synthetase
MLHTFNCGIGLISRPRQGPGKTLKKLKAMKQKAYVVGEIKSRKGKEAQVEFTGRETLV